MTADKSVITNLHDADKACPVCGESHAHVLTLPSGHRALQCNNCTLVWATEQQDTSQIYDSAYDESTEGFTWRGFLRAHDRMKAGLEVSLNWFEKPFAQSDAVPGGGKLLEVGCSVGRFLYACKNAGWDVSGLDISQRAVELAQQVLHESQIHCGTLDKTPWPDNTFDMITIWEVIEHVHDPLAMVRNAARLIKAGGYLAVSTPDWGAWAVRRHPKENYWPPFHLLFFNEQSIRKLMSLAGLEIVTIVRNTIPWSETCWPKWKRLAALPYLFTRGVVLGEGGGRLVVKARKLPQPKTP